MFKNIKLPNINTRYSLFLLLFACFSIFDLFIHEQNNIGTHSVNIGLVILTSMLGYIGVQYFSKVKLNIWYLIISQTILFLLIHPSNSIVYFPLSVLITILLKETVRYKGAPIFNPAGFGLFVTFYLSYVLQKLGLVKETLFVSWWGGDIMRTIYENPKALMIIPAILFATFIYYIHRFRKGYNVFSFIVTYIASVLIFSLMNEAPLNLVLTLPPALMASAFGFLALVMIAEPKTSPVQKKDQIVLGLAGGIILFLITFILPLLKIEILTAVDPFILGLLILNLLTFWNKYRLLHKKTEVTTQVD